MFCVQWPASVRRRGSGVTTDSALKEVLSVHESSWEHRTDVQMEALSRPMSAVGINLHINNIEVVWLSDSRKLQDFEFKSVMID